MNDKVLIAWRVEEKPKVEFISSQTGYSTEEILQLIKGSERLLREIGIVETLKVICKGIEENTTPETKTAIYWIIDRTMSMNRN